MRGLQQHVTWMYLRMHALRWHVTRMRVCVCVCARPGEWDPPPAEIARRVDLRSGFRVFSVDPPGCKDIDDALHVRSLGPGRTEVASADAAADA